MSRFDAIYKRIVNEYNDKEVETLKKKKAGLEKAEAEQAEAEVTGDNDPKKQENIEDAQSVVDTEIADKEIERAEEIKKRAEQRKKGA